VPNEPLVTVSVTGTVSVACFTIEEILPGSATALNISGDGVYLPALNAVRWGPYFNTVATNVSYRVTGLPASYPINGGAWMDGQWYFSPGITMVTVLSPAGSGGTPSPPPQVATPSFTPPSGATVPTNVTISCATPGAVIYYTLDGSLPTQSSMLYTVPVYLASASVVRAAAFTNGWTPSVASVAYYGPPAAPVNAQVTQTVDTNSPTAPVVTFSVTPGTNASCIAVTETLPVGISATNVSSGGSYVASNNVVLWGPFFGTNVWSLSYQAVGQPGVYPVQASWSVDGVSTSQVAATSIVIASAGEGNPIPTPPPQVATPTFMPASGTNVPASVTITDATPGAVIYYTLDGSLPTQSSMLYTGPIYVSSLGVLRAAAFTNGWLASVSSVAYYGPPAAPANAQVTRTVNTNSPTAPLVTFNVTPGAGADCVTLTETLPPGVSVINVSSGGSYVASNNVVLWGPFFGTNPQILSYQAVGGAGDWPVQASWSVDGVSGSETSATTLAIASSSGSGSIPTPPQQVPTPVLTPSLASGLPVTVSVSCSDPHAQIYYTTDGTLPTQSSMPYTILLTFYAQTSLRAVAYDAGYVPSVAAVGEYVPVPTTNTVTVDNSVSGNGTFLPTVSLSATPQGAVNCYAVVETIPYGLTPSGLSGDGIWDPVAGEIRWGPYLDNLPRVFTYSVTGASGIYPLCGEVSVNGYSMGTIGASSVQINANYGGAPVTNLAACATDFLTYTVDINPAPGIVTVTSATGTVTWGDGTQSAITQPVQMLQKAYSSAGNYSIVVSANWTGYTSAANVSGFATTTNSVQVVTTCVPPQIVTQPTNEVVVAGSTAQFTVSASSSVPMFYQWYFNTNAPISSPSSFATLTLPNVTPLSAGSYSVIISNAFGSVTSSVASLTVELPFQAWQNYYFRSSTNPAAAPGADPLGKGISNTNQFLLGLNPTNPASVFRIIAISLGGGTNTVTWKTSGGDLNAASFYGPTVITNIVQGSVGAATGSYSNNFSDISGPLIILPPGDTVTNYPDASGTNRFYRIRLGP